MGGPSCVAGARGGLPVEAVVQPLPDGAEVGGVGHHGAVERVVPQVHRQRKRLRHVWRGQHVNKHVNNKQRDFLITNKKACSAKC